MQKVKQTEEKKETAKMIQKHPPELNVLTLGWEAGLSQGSGSQGEHSEARKATHTHTHTRDK